MYLDNLLNKLLPSCLLLPLLLRVISVLIVFLSIWSHCFSGPFLCYFPSTKINHKHPSELGARDMKLQERVSPPEAKSCFPLCCMKLLNMRQFGSMTIHGACVGTWCLFNLIALKAKGTQDTTLYCVSVWLFTFLVHYSI